MDIKPVKDYDDAKYPDLLSVVNGMRKRRRGMKIASAAALTIAASMSLTMCGTSRNRETARWTSTAGAALPETSDETTEETSLAGKITITEETIYDTALAGDIAVTEESTVSEETALAGVIIPSESSLASHDVRPS